MKGGRRAWDASNIAQRPVKRLEHQFHNIVAVGFGVAVGAKQSPPEETGEGQGVRRKAEQRRLGDGE